MLTVPAELVAVYASLFVHCWSQYAVQQCNGSYWRVREPLTLAHVVAHLEGRWTLGTYLLDENEQCAFAVFDADHPDGLVRLAGLAMELAAQGIATILEVSRRGGHLWVHLAEPTPAALVRSWLLPFALALDVEFYPKQDRLGPDGAGSLIRLPLGVHQRSRGWYPFVQPDREGTWAPVGETVWDCCEWVSQAVQRVAVPASVQVVPALPASVSGDHDRSTASQERGLRPGRSPLRAWCQAQDIVEVIGHYTALDRRGVGSCPFKEHHYRGDMRPSFQVFGGDDPHWYCYTWQRAGNLLDFLCLYYHLTPHQAWQQLQHGLLLF